MERFLQQSRLTIAAVTVALWFGGLNLCAFKLLGTDTAKASGCPCCHTTPGAKPAASFCDKYSGQEAAPQLHPDSISHAVAALPVIGFRSPEALCAPQGPFFAARETTHPPGGRSFAERVLQTSLLTQAPPVA